MKTKKERCGSTRHFNIGCYHGADRFQYLKVEVIEWALRNNLEIIEDILWDREKYRQSLLFTTANGMNSILDLYSSKKKGCRKR